TLFVGRRLGNTRFGAGGRGRRHRNLRSQRTDSRRKTVIGSSAMAAQASLWDVMDTLVSDPFRHVMPAFFGMTLPEMLALKHPTAWRRFERNELSEAEFLASFFSDGRAYDREGFKAAVRASYAWIEGVEPLLAALRERGVDMHAFSNYPEWYAWIEE